MVNIRAWSCVLGAWPRGGVGSGASRPPPRWRHLRCLRRWLEVSVTGPGIALTCRLLSPPLCLFKINPLQPHLGISRVCEPRLAWFQRKRSSRLPCERQAEPEGLLREVLLDVA